MSSAAPAIPEEVQILATQSEDITQQAERLQVETAEDAERAAGLLRGIKELRGQIQESYEPHVKRAYKLHKELVAEKKRHDEPLEKAERALKRRVDSFLEAEEARVEAERAAAAKALESGGEDARIARAEALEAAGDDAGALAALDAPAPPPQAAPTKVGGVSRSVRWRADVLDLEALVQAVAKGEAPIHYLKADQTALNKAAQALGKTFRCPGVQAVKEGSIAVRR